MRRQTTAVGATLTACGILLASTTLVAHAATPQTSQANAALRYLYSQVAPDGNAGGSFGLGGTEDAVISVADNGYDPATLKSPATGTPAYSYLRAQRSTITTAGGAAKYVLAWVAAGRPAAIDGAGLLSRLNRPASAGGYRNANGAFHNTTVGETANAYSQSLAVLADVAAGHALPAHAVGWLVCAQRPDGGFGYAIDDAAATPPAFCGDSASDTNDTAIILQALGAARSSAATAAAEVYLHSAQQNDGGFGFPGSASDPNSDATVIQALVALGQDPIAPAWTVGGGANAISDLESFADPSTGGYMYPGQPPDAGTTSGIPQALALKPYAAATTFLPGSTPPPPVTATPTPTQSVKGITVTVPPTGAGSETSIGSALPAVLLLALGAVTVATASLRRRPRPVP